MQVPEHGGCPPLPTQVPEQGTALDVEQPRLEWCSQVMQRRCNSLNYCAAGLVEVPVPYTLHEQLNEWILLPTSELPIHLHIVCLLWPSEHSGTSFRVSPSTCSGSIRCQVPPDAQVTLLWGRSAELSHVSHRRALGFIRGGRWGRWYPVEMSRSPNAGSGVCTRRHLLP